MSSIDRVYHHLLAAFCLMAIPLDAAVAADAVVVDASGNTAVNGSLVVTAGASVQVSLRIVPLAASGAPTTGTWSTGAMVVDSSGSLYQCTLGGTPGMWANLTIKSAPLFVDVRKDPAVAQSVTANVTSIKFTQEVEDAGNAWNQDTFTCPSSGLYLISGQWVTNVTANWYVYKNGGVIANGGVNNPYNPLNLVLRLAAGDTLTFRSTVTTSIINGDGNANRMTFTRLGD